MVILFLLMEIKIYGSFELRNIGKSMYCVRVANPDTFDYQKTIEVLKCLYGADKIIEILVV